MTPEPLVSLPVCRRSFKHPAYSHYSLAAFLFIAHVGCGLSGILLDHEWSLTSVDKIAVAITGLGATVATVITTAMVGVHLASA